MKKRLVGFGAMVALLLTLAVAFVDAQSTACDPTVDYASAAMTAYDAGEYEASLPDFFCATGLDPQNIDLQYAATVAALRSGHMMSVFRYSDILDALAVERYDVMAAEAQAALEANPNDEQAAVLLLFANYPIQQEDIDRILAINPESAAAYIFTARMAFNDADAARAAVDHAIELAPDDAEVLSAAASTYLYGTPDYETARSLIARALEAAPMSVDAIKIRAEMYQMMDETDAALTDFNRAIALDPYDLKLRSSRGFLLYSLEQYEEALADFAYVVSVYPGAVGAVTKLIEIALITGNADERALAAESFLNTAAERIDSDAALTAESPVMLTMTAGRMVRIPVTLEAGQEVTISALAADSDSLDPRIMVVDPAGGAVAYNDDVAADGGDYSAVATFTTDLPGEYRVLVTHSGAGTEGEMTVTLTSAD